MSVQFIIGRAGCGKTHRCLSEIHNHLRQDRAHGPKLVFIVPEQAALQMERQVIAPDDIRASHRAEVLSFKRLAKRILDSVGDAPPHALTDPARVMVLRHLIAGAAGELRYFKRQDRIAGLVERLSHTISELLQEDITPEELADSARQIGDEDPAQSAKLQDIATVYSAYRDYLKEGKYDPSQYLSLARKRMDACEWLNGAHVWVDGFASLMREETLTLLELAKRSKTTLVTVLCDPDLIHRPSTNTSHNEASQLFSKTYNTYKGLHKEFVQAGLAVEDPLLIRERNPHRFQSQIALSQIERRIFSPPDPESPEDRVACKGIAMVELPSPRWEVEYAVSRVLDWVRDKNKGYRFSDVAIVARSLEPYHDLLVSALNSRGIPFFIDRRRPIAHHPLVELLRALPAIVSKDFSVDSARVILKTGLTPLSDKQTDEIENYLIAYGIKGKSSWTEERWEFVPRSGFVIDEGEEHRKDAERDKNESLLQRVNESKEQLIHSLSSWIELSSGKETMNGTHWCQHLTQAILSLGADKRLAEWAESAKADGDLDQAEVHRQVWDDVMSLLDDIAMAFESEEISVSDLTDILEAGLAGLTLGLAPQMLDQVLVGSIERSRHPELKAVILLGFNDGLFPQRAQEDSILNDDDRQLLLDSGLELLPPSRTRFLDESLLIYVAVTRASEELVISFSSSDDSGKQLRPSPAIDAIREALPSLEIERISEPSSSRGLWDIHNRSDLMRRLASEFRNRPELDLDKTKRRAQFNELYESARSCHEQSSLPELSGLGSFPAARLESTSVEKLIRPPFRTSVSELETYATCPFQHFSKYGLRLKERPEAILEPVDIGQVHHAILEDFVQTCARGGSSLSRLSETDLLAQLSKSCSRVASRIPDGGKLSHARDEYILRRSHDQLSLILKAQKKIAGAGKAAPKVAEQPFGYSTAESLPPLELSTPNGRRVMLRGFIDRVDLAELADDLLGVVIDYKRTAKKQLDLSSVYHGLSLQLIAYLLVLEEQGESLAGRPITPGGALFVSLIPQYEKVSHPDDYDPEEMKLVGACKPRGLISERAISALDDPDQLKWSKHFSVYRNKDGNLGMIDSSDGAKPEDFSAVLDNTRQKLGELADRLLCGEVEAMPYRLGTSSPCTWCPMASVCRFEMGLGSARFLPKLKRSEIFSRLKDRSNNTNS